MSVTDRRGVAFSVGDDGSLEIYERALSAFNFYRGDPVAIIDEALEVAPNFVMGEIFRGYMFVSSWEESAVVEVNTGLARLDVLVDGANERERAHMAVLRDWSAGDWQGMRTRLDRILMECPRDLLALQIGHLADFFMGDRDNLRGRIARALPAWLEGEVGHGLALGMLAFGQEECGDYRRSEENAGRALNANATDCWARHALAHVMEMEGRQAEGAQFMEESAAHWAQEDNTFAFHNWWHTALFHLDQGDVAKSLKLYDSSIHPGSEEAQVTLLDSVSLLWRLHLGGEDVGARWQSVADCYEALGEAGFYAFNDMHAMMAYTAAGRRDAAEKHLAAVEKAAQKADANSEMERCVGLPVLRALAAFGRHDFAQCAEHLLPIRDRSHAFGGSHAQRDIIHRTLIEAALRSSDKALAETLSEERLMLKPKCSYSLSLKERANMI
ncbi:MAG: hypothetical protein CMM54_12015 [Rhodospirillaceae bacterium]|nr:hypothetical protein [Rhodospirillaceae bacterium]